MINNGTQRIHEFLLTHPYLNPYGFSFDRLFRNITARKRMLPKFLILGYPKCGTTALYDYLTQHENIHAASRKEIHYFSSSYWRGKNWYKSNFPLNKKGITGEASPNYIFYLDSLKRIHNDLANVKLILLLRDPIDRAYSNYNHQSRMNKEPLNSFEDAINEDESRYDFIIKNSKTLKGHNRFLTPYLSIGKYARTVKELLSLFPREQILFLNSNDLSLHPKETTNKVLEFLNMPQSNKINFDKKNIGKYSKMNPETRSKLEKYYFEYNLELEKLVGINFNL